MRLADRNEVIKHSSAIQIQSKITHLQRRAWNVLLANAYDELPTNDIHNVRIVELAEKLEFDSGNKDYLKDTLEALVNCKVKWNLLDKDKKDAWGVASLLASTEIRDGICTYGFAPHLRPKLHNPRIYAKINLKLQNKFKGKYALILWELCVDYFDESRNEGETPFIPLEEFKELMGLDNSEYPQFKLLNHYVIKRALKEINKITDFYIEAEQQKRGRKVIALKFRIRKIKKISEKKETGKQGTMFPEHEDMEGVALILHQVGVSIPEALKIFNQEWGCVKGERPEDMDFEEYIKEKIHLMQGRSGLSNKTGFLLSAIRENYPNPDYKKEVKQSKIKEMEDYKATLDKEWKSARSERARNLINDNDDLLEQAAEDMKQGMKHGYATEKLDIHDSVTEAYEKEVTVRSSINAVIKENFPDKFADIDAEYEERINAFKKEIEELKRA